MTQILTVVFFTNLLQNKSNIINLIEIILNFVNSLLKNTNFFYALKTL